MRCPHLKKGRVTKKGQKTQTKKEPKENPLKEAYI